MQIMIIKTFFNSHNRFAYYTEKTILNSFEGYTFFYRCYSFHATPGVLIAFLDLSSFVFWEQTQLFCHEISHIAALPAHKAAQLGEGWKTRTHSGAVGLAGYYNQIFTAQALPSPSFITEALTD